MRDDSAGRGNISITASQCLQDTFRDVHLAKRTQAAPEEAASKTYQEGPVSDGSGAAPPPDVAPERD